jgi:hypothetical protein
MRTKTPTGFGFPLGAVLACATTFLVVAAGAASQPVLSVVALVVVVGFVAVTSTATATAATAVVAWCLHAGFVLGREGDLEFSARSGHAALVIGLFALIAAVLAETARAAAAVVHHAGQPAVAPISLPQARSHCYVEDRAGLQAAALRR